MREVYLLIILISQHNKVRDCNVVMSEQGLNGTTQDEEVKAEKHMKLGILLEWVKYQWR